MAERSRGFLKICATILPEVYHPDLDLGLTEDETEEINHMS